VWTRSQREDEVGQFIRIVMVVTSSTGCLIGSVFGGFVYNEMGFVGTTTAFVLPCAFVLVVSSPILLCMLSPANEKNDGERGQHKIVVDSGIFTWGACFVPRYAARS